MAGGMGVRLKPFTDVLPKPLIPINGKPIIQLILDKFLKKNFTNVYIYLSDIKRNYKSIF